VARPCFELEQAVRHLLRKAALHELRRTAAGAAPQHTLRVRQQLRRHSRGGPAGHRGANTTLLNEAVLPDADRLGDQGPPRMEVKAI